MTTEDGTLSGAQYAAIAAFRTRLRRFLAFSEAAAGAEGLAQQQHQALLVLAGHSGDEAPGVGAVAEALLIAPHSAAELVARMVDAGLLHKTRSVRDRRKVELTLTEKAEALLHRLTEAHLAELRALEPALADAIGAAGRAIGQKF
jgi:DNA-binding MarR family transcriptional regulator